MQILFFWLRDNGCFNNQGFNFSSEFRFKFDAKQLFIEENPGHISNFYNLSDKDPKINSVTAIVGENGAGKTFLLNNLRVAITSGYSNYISDNDFLIAYELNDQYFIFSGSPFKIVGSEKFVRASKSKFLSDKNKLKVIFYSSAFTSAPESSEEIEGSINLSTNFLVYNSAKQQFENHHSENLPNQIHYYQINEFEKQVAFLADNPTFLTDLNYKCKYIEMALHENKLNDFDQAILKKIPTPISTFLSEMLKYVEIQDRNARDLDNFRWSLIKSYWFLFLRYLNSFQNFLPADPKLPSLDCPNISPVDFLKRYMVAAINAIFPNTVTLPNNSIVNSGFAKDVIEKIEALTQLLDAIKNLEPKSYGTRAVLFPIESDISFLSNIYKLYSKSIPLTGFYATFKFGPPMSSGMQSYLTIHSRFFDVVAKLKKFKKNDMPENLIILMDEGELYFHPQWQQKYLFNLINFYKKLFSDKVASVKNIQVILATNTPLVLTDILRDDTIFLSRGEVVKCDFSQPFGASLNDLFSDSFFIDNGLVGDFAKNKIDEILLFLNSDQKDFQKREYFKKLIFCIGNDFAREYLLKKIASKESLNDQD